MRQTTETMLKPGKVRFGEILAGENFRFKGSEVLFRRIKGRFAARVSHIGGHVDGASSSGFPFDLDMEVVKAKK